MKLAQHNRNKSQHNEISTTQQKQVANTMKLAQHNTMKLAQHNRNKSQHNEISTTQQKQVATQWN